MKYSQIHLTLTFILTLLTINTHCQDTPWKNIGPFMRTINAMAIDNSHPDTVYAAYPQGVYRSYDRAENWFVTGLTNVEINSIIVSQNNPNLLLANSDSSVYKSEDYGESWQMIWQTDNDLIGAVAVDPDNDNSIWIGVNVGMFAYDENLFHSDDGGLSWESVFFSEEEEVKLQGVRSIHFDRSNSNVIYVCGNGDRTKVDGGLYVSRDKGKTWTNYRPGGGSSNDVQAVTTTFETQDPQAAYILVGIAGSKRELYRSLDYGDTWIEIDVPTWEDSNLERDYFDFFANVMDFDPLEPEWLYFGGNYQDEASLLGYNCEEDSWHYFPGTPLKNPTSLAMHPNVWYMGFRNDGIFRFADEDDDWVPKNEGLNDVEIYDFDLFPDYPNKIVAVIDDYIAHTYDTGTTWSRRTESVYPLRVNPQDTNTYFSGEVPTDYDFGDPFYCQRSRNRGQTWISYKIFSREGIADVSYQMGIADIHIFPTEPDIVMVGVDGGEGCGEGLYRSEDGGSTWFHLYNFGVSAIAMDPQDNSNIYFGTTNLGYVYKSDDWGESGTLISPEGAEAFATDIYDLGIDKNHKVLAATSSGLFEWQEGEEWTLVESFPVGTTKSIIIDNIPAIPVYYIGTKDQGIFVSDDGGVSWESFNAELDNLSITKLMLNEADPKNLFAGTSDGGIWITSVDEYKIELETVRSKVPELSIFPNPSSGKINIYLNDISNSRGRLKIYNLMGVVVYSADDIVLVPDNIHVVYPGDMVPGNYILEFTNDRYTTNKMITVK